MTEGSAEGAAWQSTSGGLAFHMRRLIEPPEGAVLLPILQTKKLGIPAVNRFARSTFRFEILYSFHTTGPPDAAQDSKEMLRCTQGGDLLLFFVSRPTTPESILSTPLPTGKAKPSPFSFVIDFEQLTKVRGTTLKVYERL